MTASTWRTLLKPTWGLVIGVGFGLVVSATLFVFGFPVAIGVFMVGGLACTVYALTAVLQRVG